MSKFVSKLTPEELIDALQYRAAIKSFVSPKNSDPKVKEEIEKSIKITKQILQLTPTSYGLQPYQFLFVTNPTLREELKQASYNQVQVTDADFLVVLCVKTSINEQMVDEYIAQVVTTRGVDKAKLAGFVGMINGTIKKLGKEGAKVWAEKQAYIALGNVLTGLAVLGIDSCPMEGFEEAKYDSILKLKEKNLTTVLALPVGMRCDNDPANTQKKVRFPIEKLCIDVK